MNFYDVFMKTLTDRGLLKDGQITCTTAQFDDAFQHTIAILLEAEDSTNCCADDCDCGHQADGAGDAGSYCEHGDPGDENQKEPPVEPGGCC